MRMFGKSSCRHSSCERGLLLSIFDFKRKKYRTFLQDSETGEEIAEEYEKGRGVWKKHDVQDGKGSEMRENLIRKHYWCKADHKYGVPGERAFTRIIATGGYYRC